jgi:hypothetical protein
MISKTFSQKNNNTENRSHSILAAKICSTLTDGYSSAQTNSSESQDREAKDNKNRIYVAETQTTTTTQDGKICFEKFHV